MAKISYKRFGELVQGLFRILQEHPEGMKAKEALAQLAKNVPPTEYEAGNYGNTRRFEKLVRFATINAVRAGWLVKEDGIWTLTKAGAAALKKYKEPLEFHKMAVQLYRQWAQNRTKDETMCPDTGGGDAEEVEDESVKSVSVSY